MSKKWMALFAGVVGSLAVGFTLAGTMQGCGGGGGGSDLKSLCKQGCDKAAACVADADAMTISDFKMQCQAVCDAQQTNCANDSERVAAAKACLDTSNCNTAGACDLPPCQSTTGTGGSTGAGGTTGTGGGGGSSAGGCANCVKADACCMALGGTAAQCMSAAMCEAQPAANQGTLDSGCAMGLAAIVAAQPNAPAACK